MTSGDSGAPITVLLTDIEGSTELHSRLGDVEARERVRTHDDIVRAALEEFGGREVKTMGDGFLVTFASTRRALACAGAIQQSISEQTELRVRIGLHVGEVIVEAEDIHGAAVAAAARIMSLAHGGQILASDLVRQLAGATDVGFRDWGSRSLKGLDGSWRLHEVLWRGDASTSPPSSGPVDPAWSLMAREAELLALEAAIGAAQGGNGRLLLIAGEPGIGKTSLAVAAANHAGRQGIAVRWGSCWEGGGAPAYWPWVQILRSHASELTDDELDAAAGLGAGDLLRIVPDLSNRLPGASPPPDLDPEQARFRLFDAVTTTLCRTTARRPLVLVLEDLHWADEASLLLLGFVAAQLPTSSITVIGTYRDNEVRADPSLARHFGDLCRRAQLLDVAALDEPAVAALITQTARVEPTSEVAAAVHRRTGGNPLFVTEVTRLLAANGRLGDAGGGLGIPAGVREVIERRLVRLPQPCVDLLETAATIGEEFPIDLVAASASVGVPDVADAMDLAVDGGAVHIVDTGRYRFAHALFREALYEGLAPAKRRSLHLQVALALESRHLERRSVPASELAKHFAEAALSGHAGQAVRYSVLAGDEATRALAYGEAVRQYERAVSLLDLADDLDGDRAELLLTLGDARRRAGDRIGAHADITHAIRQARRTSRPETLARAALSRRDLGDVSGAPDSESLTLLREAATALGDAKTALRARVLAGLAQQWYHSWHHRGESDAAALMAAEAVAIARELDDASTLSAALLAQHDVAWRVDHEAERVVIATELETAARNAGSWDLAAEAKLLQAVALIELSDPRGVGCLEAFVTQAELLRQPHFEYLAATRRATLGIIRGDVADVERHIMEARSLAERCGEPDAATVEDGAVFSINELRGDHRETALRAVRVHAGPGYAEFVRVFHCLALADTGDERGARRLLADLDLDQLEQRHGGSYRWLYAMASLARTAVVIDDDELLARAEAALAPHAGKCIVVAGAVGFFGSVSHYLGIIYAATGRHDLARAAFDEALSAYAGLGAEGWAEKTRRARAGLDAEPSDPPARLVRQGSVWSICFAGTEVSVKDAKGMHDLARLLGSPRTEIAATELITQDLAAAIGGGADPVLDDRAKRELRGRLADLDDDLAEAERHHDLERAASVASERDAIIHELTSALGLGGRSRGLGDPAERARKAVTARIRDAIGRIGAVHPSLGHHLDASVRTGSSCSYEPSSSVWWQVTDVTAR